MRACLDVAVPPSSTERIKQNNLPLATKVYKRKFPDYLLQAIDWAMAIHPDDRPQSVAELAEALSV
jgi:hypothetical protein